MTVPQTQPEDGTALDVLLEYLKRTRGFDFTGYKHSSLERRIEKRMQEVGIGSYQDYVDYLEVQSDEFAFLFNTILINVTGFFRDAAAWDYLATHIVPEVLQAVSADRPLRFWCAGCSSGEETYTLAMVLAEALGEQQYLERVKIYATDVDEEALSEARHATYSAKAVEPVPPALLERYFERVEQRYAFRKELRRTVIFGRNDLVQDAPISRVDLLTCRNTLMYFNAETQASIIGRFHFSLNDWGYLYLGKSEMLITHSELFKPVDLKRRVFSKVARPTLRDRLLFAAHPGHVEMTGDGGGVRESALDATPVAQVAVDADGIVVLANRLARTTFGLSLADVGRPLKDLEISYRPVDLRSNIEAAHVERRAIAVTDVSMTISSGDVREFEVQLTPLYADERSLGTTVTFADVTARQRVQRELEASKVELENAYEELQSTVEELETTNEELQSTNEELETINDELRERTLELNEVNAFLETILTSMGVGVVVLDRSLSIQVWNAHSSELWGLRADEAEGRNLLALELGLPVEELRGPLRDVARQLQVARRAQARGHQPPWTLHRLSHRRPSGERRRPGRLRHDPAHGGDRRAHRRRLTRPRRSGSLPRGLPLGPDPCRSLARDPRALEHGRAAQAVLRARLSGALAALGQQRAVHTREGRARAMARRDRRDRRDVERGRDPARGARRIGVGAQQPRAVVASHQGAVAGQLGQGERDGRPPSADEAAEGAVGDPDRHHDAGAGDLAPALGEMPHQRPQAQLDARELRDGALLGGACRLAGGARDEPGAQRRPRVQRRQHPLVEDGHGRRGAHVPALPGGQEAFRRVADRDEIPGSEQVGGGRLGEADLAHDEPVADHEGEGAASHRPQRVDAPRPALEPDGGHADAIARAHRKVAERLGKVGVEVEQALPSHDGAVVAGRCQPDCHRKVVPPRGASGAWGCPLPG